MFHKLIAIEKESKKETEDNDGFGSPAVDKTYGFTLFRISTVNL
jgi:hypothetical protein